jgi:hypothetical protein
MFMPSGVKVMTPSLSCVKSFINVPVDIASKQQTLFDFLPKDLFETD